ncbi:hypothetical protein BT67DRAFT_385720 [Trichocladium antarcticum]|uniref:BTB domain-containing protein n=1 Tax=Trichocladium antarcticum TaxID=1450529 RepID=A0AAN6UGA2_9PEZI|nr:hypothetical protein BT67DRAFT_385720 [Trichocladium antarcticum]
MWMGDPDGDITLEFEGWAWKVKADILGAHFPWMNSAFPNSVPGSHVVCAGISGGIEPETFVALLEFLHTNEFRGHTWESEPSFLTYVEAYFAAESLCIETLRTAMVERVENLSRTEEKHLQSFVDAIVSVETHKWSPKIQKAMYDAGERMKDRLVGLLAFRELTEDYPAGKGFAQAIGLERL